ncbi:MAG: hypothetical protein SF182_21495 [Deltaproteobacteria bacterium]|nr:hypothetical protein [Deltaproteobacteria bacterium]
MSECTSSPVSIRDARAHAPTRAALVLLALLGAAPTWGAPGYAPRPCGFDLATRNGVRGEAADCNVCDGVTTDVDGNGVADVQRYVDCGGGNDSSGSGTPAAPFKTIQKALDSLPGPAANQIEAVCIKGVCGGAIGKTYGTSGAAGVYTLPASGSQATDFEYPRYPLIISGWDADNDGSYPPYDTDDVAVLDGNLTAPTMANLVLTVTARTEVAHLTVRDYGVNLAGTACATTNQGTAASRFLNSGVHIFTHDVELERFNKFCNSITDWIVFDFFGSNDVRYVAVENVSSIEQGSYFARGEADKTKPNGDEGPLRFQHVTMTARPCDGCAVAAFKLYRHWTGIELLDSVLDANTAAYGGASYQAGYQFAVGASCNTRQWTIRNNRFSDWMETIQIEPVISEPGYCYNDASKGAAALPRSIDDVVIDRNVIRNTYPGHYWGVQGIVATPARNTAPGNDANYVVEDLTITNNVIASTTAMACMHLAPTHNVACASYPPSTVTIAGNTCVADVERRGDPDRWALLVIGNANPSGLLNGGVEGVCKQQHFIVKDNVFAGMSSGDRAVCTEWAPSDWQADGNVFDRGSAQNAFLWNVNNDCGAGAVPFATWRTASGGDAASRLCAPRFANAAAGDFHLAAGDSCARDAGVPLSGITGVDLDGEPRGTPPDAGADELIVSGAPPAPVLIEAVPLP